MEELAEEQQLVEPKFHSTKNSHQLMTLWTKQGQIEKTSNHFVQRQKILPLHFPQLLSSMQALSYLDLDQPFFSFFMSFKEFHEEINPSKNTKKKKKKTDKTHVPYILVPVAGTIKVTFVLVHVLVVTGSLLVAAAGFVALFSRTCIPDVPRKPRVWLHRSLDDDDPLTRLLNEAESAVTTAMAL